MLSKLARELSIFLVFSFPFPFLFPCFFFLFLFFPPSQSTPCALGSRFEAPFDCGSKEASIETGISKTLSLASRTLFRSPNWGSARVGKGKTMERKLIILGDDRPEFGIEGGYDGDGFG